MRGCNREAGDAHRPLEEEEVVLVHGDAVAEREVARADKRIVDRHRAVHPGVHAWRVLWAGLVAKGERIPAHNRVKASAGVLYEWELWQGTCCLPCLHANSPRRAS